MLEEPDNPSFGELLRFYRERSVDRHVRARFSQDHFAMRLSEKTGLMVTRNKVSNWETGKTRITADDRDTLLSILTVLYAHDGITSPDEANQLLEAGNYRSLKPAEVQQIFHHQETDLIPQHNNLDHLYERKTVSSALEATLLKTELEFRRIFAEAKVGPGSAWPRVFVALTHAALARWTIFHVLRGIGWVWLWLLTWWLIAPSLRWPFDSDKDAITSMAMYVGATILVPPCISLLISLKDDDFWHQKLTTTRVLRLYLYQGAGIGFHLGYFACFFLTLVIYHFHFRTAAWLELLVASISLLLGYAGAQLIPYNLWRAYGRLHTSDGAVFFIFLILGPVWGYFFLNFYSYLLTPVAGLVVVLLAATSLTALMAWRKRRVGSTLIPSHWWSLIYGSFLVLYEISSRGNWYNVSALAGLILLFSTLLALGRINVTLTGLLVATVGVGLVLIALNFNLWIGLTLAGLLIVIWWGWGRRLLSFPASFWAVLFLDGACGWAMQRGLLSELSASIAVAAVALLVLLWERTR